MASPGNKYDLVFYVNGNLWRRTPVSLKKPIGFGMSEKCNVKLSSSGKLDLLDEHAWLQMEDGQIMLQIAGKTKVNGTEIPAGKIPYNIGDKIQFGEKDKLLLVLEAPALGEQPKTEKPKEKKNTRAKNETESALEQTKSVESSTIKTTKTPNNNTKSPKQKSPRGKKVNEKKETVPVLEENKPVEAPIPLLLQSTEENKTESDTPNPTQPSTADIEPEATEAAKEEVPTTRSTRNAGKEANSKTTPKVTPQKTVKETKTKTPPKTSSKATAQKAVKETKPRTPKQSKPPKSNTKAETSTESSQPLFPTPNATITPSPQEKRTRSTSITPVKDTPPKGSKTPQTNVVVEITENGNTYKIPPIRTKEEVDAMGLDNILLEMCSLSKGHDSKVSQFYIKKWYAKKVVTLEILADALRKLASEGKLLTKDFQEGKKTITCYYDINQPVTDDEGEPVAEKNEEEIPQNAITPTARSKRKIESELAAESKKRKVQEKTNPEEKTEDMAVENNITSPQEEVKDESKELAKEGSGMDVENGEIDTM